MSITPNDIRDIIEHYRNVVIQIATPYSTGTGFYLKRYNLIITNEHVIKGNRQVVIEGVHFKKQLCNVRFTDKLFDLAFLEAPKDVAAPAVELGLEVPMDEGDQIVAIGHPFGLKYTATKGIVSNTAHKQNDVEFLQHDAALNPGNSGGPLISIDGKVVGVNTFIIRDGNNIGFSLPVKYLFETIENFKKTKGEIVVKCSSCFFMVTDENIDHKYCPNCGTKIELPTEVDEYEATGIPRSIEEIIANTGNAIKLARRGPNHWEIQQGSAKIDISYHEKTGLIIGDAQLCLLPKENIQPLYEYLLRQNFDINGLSFSVKGQNIVLSLLIHDKYFNTKTGTELFKRLFEKADHYDDILVNQFGGQWKEIDQ